MNSASRHWQHAAVLTAIGLSVSGGNGCGDTDRYVERGPYLVATEIHSPRVESRAILVTQERWSVATTGRESCELTHYVEGSFEADVHAPFDSELQRLIPLTTALEGEDPIGALRDAERGSLGLSFLDDEVLEWLGLGYGEHWRLLPPDSGQDNLLAKAIRELIDEAYAEAMASTDDPDCQP